MAHTSRTSSPRVGSRVLPDSFPGERPCILPGPPVGARVTRRISAGRIHLCPLYKETRRPASVTSRGRNFRVCRTGGSLDGIGCTNAFLYKKVYLKTGRITTYLFTRFSTNLSKLPKYGGNSVENMWKTERGPGRLLSAPSVRYRWRLRVDRVRQQSASPLAMSRPTG